MVRVLSLLSALTLLAVQDASAATKTTTMPTTASAVTAAATPGLKLHGVNYNIRAGADWEPDATKCKSADVIAQELVKLKRVTDTIRLYSLTDCDQAAKVLPAAVKAGLKVSLGLWVGSEPATFAAEKTKFQELLAQDGLINSKDIVGIHVGSEAIYRGEVNVTTAIANVKEIKSLCVSKTLNVPITIADTTEIYLKYPSLIDAVDFASPNVFPFWDRITAEKGPDQLYSKIEKLKKIAKGKDIVIGETGWPTDGVEPKGSKASMANAATYFKGFYNLAQKHQLKYYYFAGFDEQWKLSSASANSTVEAYFGLFDKTGELKDAYTALKPASTVVPIATPTAAPAVVPSVTPAAKPSAAPSKAPLVSSAAPSSAPSPSDDVSEPAKSAKAPVTTAAPSVDAGDEGPKATGTSAPAPAATVSDAAGTAVTKAPVATGSSAATTTTSAPVTAISDATNVAATKAPIVAGVVSTSSPATAVGDSSGNAVIPAIGGAYVPGAVTGAKDDADSTTSKSSSADPATTGPSGTATAAVTKKPKRKDCDV